MPLVSPSSGLRTAVEVVFVRLVNVSFDPSLRVAVYTSTLVDTTSVTEVCLELVVVVGVCWGVKLVFWAAAEEVG